MIRFLTAGESHGDSLVGIIEGLPANLKIDEDFINRDLKRRQSGYGRSSRMSIENDRVIFKSGVKDGYSTGNPISFELLNRGTNIETKEVYRPRPGHGDLVGSLKYNQQGARSTLERASARETASRVVVGSICKLFLMELGIDIFSHVISIGTIESRKSYYKGLEMEELFYSYQSDFRVADSKIEALLREYMDHIKNEGDSLGGQIEIIGRGLPVGLGSYTNWDRKLDSKLAAGLMSIQGIKSICFGRPDNGTKRGSEVHDEISYNGSYKRRTNNAGGIEAGVSNGEDLVINLAMKPIPTLLKPLKTVDINTKKAEKTMYERSDVCAVPAATIVAESMVAYVLANELLLLTGGEFMEEIKSNYSSYLKYLRGR